MESDLQLSSSDIKVRDFKLYGDNDISFYELLGIDDYYFWSDKATNDDFSQHFRWKHARVDKLGYKTWDEHAIILAHKLSAKYGIRIGEDSHPYGLSSKMRNRCTKAQRLFEKSNYYWKDK